jgi:hypothetical protein
VVGSRAVTKVLDIVFERLGIRVGTLYVKLVSETVDRPSNIAVVLERCGKVDNIATVSRAEVVPVVVLTPERGRVLSARSEW